MFLIIFSDKKLKIKYRNTLTVYVLHKVFFCKYTSSLLLSILSLVLVPKYFLGYKFK